MSQGGARGQNLGHAKEGFLCSSADKRSIKDIMLNIIKHCTIDLKGYKEKGQHYLDFMV